MTHVSHSQMTQWLRCGKAYELNRIKQAPRVPAVWLASGVALHEVIDLLNRESVTGETIDIKVEWDKAYSQILESIESDTGVARDQWKRAGRQSKDKPNKEDALWWGIEGYNELIAYRRWLSTSGYKVAVHEGEPLSEFETTATFGDVTVKGYLDAVMIDPTGKMLVMDAKSGTRVPTSQIQLALYATCLKKNLGLDIAEGGFFMTRTGLLTDTFDLSKFTDQYFASVFSGLSRAVSEEIFLPNPGDACFTCDVRDSCYTQGGINAYKYDSLHPKFVQVSDLTNVHA